jgi:sialate O-acetylesterase
MYLVRRLVTIGGIAASLVLSGAAMADVTLPRAISDHMVLQRNKPVRIWGWADAGETVTVDVAKRKASTTAGADGTWEVFLPSLPTGGPYVMNVTGKNKLQLTDVLVGEVWVCSGQSNMEWPVRITFEPEKTANESTDDGLRMFTVTKAISDTQL